MAAQGMPSFSLASVIEDVLRHQGTSPSDVDLASRRFDETALRRYEAARWLRKMAGVVLAKDLPAEPSEDDFRIGLRSGIILCNVLNKVKPGAISKVVEGSNDSVIIPDGSALMAYQYFENIRNFLDNVQEVGIPTFAASDFEKGGNTARIVGCVLALKSYAENKLGGGGSGSWKFGTNVKPPSAPKSIVRVHSEPHPRTISRSSSLSEKSLDALSSDYLIPDLSDMSNSHLSALVRSAFAGKRPDEIPLIVESILNRIMDEFDHRLAGEEGELMGMTSDFVATLDLNQSPSEPSLEEMQPSSFEEMTEMDDKKDESPLCDEMTGLDHKNDTLPSSCDEMVETDDKNDATHSSCGETTEAGGANNAQLSAEEDSNTPHSYDKHVSGCSIEKQQSLVQQQQKGVEDLKCNIHFTKRSIQDLQLKYQEDMSLLGKHFYRLAHAASGYQNVLAENRRLYNIVQDLKGNIRVYCRVRPFLRGQTNVPSVVDRIEEGTITILTPPKYYKEGKKSFTFNKVFGPKATQVEVFADTQPLVRSVLDGYNVCIFAYGQTGSGKTFTMSGPDDLTEETFGVNYRALNDLFYLSDQRKDTVSYEITVQMMEIYNEQLRDLLSFDGSIKKLDIRNSSQNGINVPDANRLPVASTADVINLMNLGQKNRAVCATAMNDRSSRSHSCLTVHVQGKDLTSGATLRGSMHLVDLAGSERVEKSEVTGDRLKEAVHINKSLSALGDVIAALAQKGAHIPYRNSKLTQLLQDSLGGQAKTLMFVHIAPDPEAVGETLSTLKFAERVSSVELGAAKVNKDSSDVKELKDQIANLKAALARKEEEPDILSCSVRSSSPDSQATKSTLSSSPSHPHPQPTKDPSNGRRSPIGDKKNSSPASRRRSLDPEDLSSWPPLNRKGDEKQMGTDDWVEKVPAKRENVDRSRSLGTAEEKKSRLAAPYSDVLNRGSDETPFDENDELEAATSDSSEQDIQTPPASAAMKRVASMPSALGSKIRKPKPSSKPQETRSMIPAVPPRRQSLGAIPHSSSAKNERQSVYMKRKTASSK